jgi:hypothetical protein
VRINRWAELLTSIVVLFVGSSAYAASPASPPLLDDELKKAYPHWPVDDESLKQLRTIEEFVRSQAGKGKAAVFDWDGTLYSERIRIKDPPRGLRHPEKLRAGQPAWHIWAASRILEKDDRNLLPSFRTAESQEERARNILRRDDYLEAMFDNEPDDVSKFLQIATFEAGMTPVALHTYLERYFKTYDPCSLAILPMLDVLQRFAAGGFSVWIVSGSNPYFIAAQVEHLERKCKRPYDFRLGKTPYDPAASHIIGNGAERSDDGSFSQSFDDRALRVSDPELDTGVFVIANKGKEVAIRQWIEGRHGQQVVFVAGNSDGDDAMAKYVLDKGKRGVQVLGIGVNPRKERFPATLESYAEQQNVRVVRIRYQERAE